MGEKERKLLKEIVKQARHPVKSRVVSQGKYVNINSISQIAYRKSRNYNCKVNVITLCITEIINKFRMKIAKFEEDINDILKQEKEEKEVKIAQVLICVIMALMV